MALHPVLNEKLNTSVLPVPQLLATHRDAVLPAVPGKVHAVIGMRRERQPSCASCRQSGATQ